MPNPHETIALSVEELARRLDCRFEGAGGTLIRGVSDPDHAREGDLVFLENPRLIPALENTRAAAAVLPPDLAFDRLPVIRSGNPRLTFFQAAALLTRPERPQPGIHPTAQVAATARLGEDVAVGAGCVIGEEAEIGSGTWLFPLVTVSPRARVGRDCRLHSHVSLRENVRIGDRVILHDGVVVGADGFGYLEIENHRRFKIPQTGTVRIEDDVEIGANSTVDRATLGETVIRRGVKIDNLVQVAHNVEIGENCVLMAQVGIAGSCRIGRNTMLCGQAGVADHIVIGENVIIAAKTGVTKNIPSGSVVSGSPHLDIREWRKAWASIPQLYDLIKQVRRLNKRVDGWEAGRGADGEGNAGSAPAEPPKKPDRA
jgi:UDP-3-O-[3-hydroxymyristoyl] glucosamine N-acyltransferase